MRAVLNAISSRVYTSRPIESRVSGTAIRGTAIQTALPYTCILMALSAAAHAQSQVAVFRGHDSYLHPA